MFVYITLTCLPAWSPAYLPDFILILPKCTVYLHLFFLVFFWFCYLSFVYLVACTLFDWMPACLPTCLSTFLPAWSSAYLPDRLPTCLITFFSIFLVLLFVFVWLVACVLCLPVYLLPDRLSVLLTTFFLVFFGFVIYLLSTWLHARCLIECLPVCLIACLPAWLRFFSIFLFLLFVFVWLVAWFPL